MWNNEPSRASQSRNADRARVDGVAVVGGSYSSLNLDKQIKDARRNALIVARFPPGGALLDLGANIGEVSITCAHRFDQVWAVEANPDTFRVMKRRIAEAELSEKIITINAVVAPESGKTYFVSRPSKCAIGSSARAQMRRKNTNGYYKKVTTIALEELLATSGARCVKMDIEGSEFECLANFTFPEFVRHFVVEFHGVATRPKRDQLFAIVNRLAASGLRLTSKLPPKNKIWYGLQTCVFER